MIIRTSIREPMALPKGDESHLLVQESNDKKLGRIVTRQCSNRVTYQLSINNITKTPFDQAVVAPELKGLTIF